MIENTSEDIWESAFRAYLLLRVTEERDKIGVAEEIFALNQELDQTNHFVVRATLVKGSFHVIVPVYARDMDRLAEVIEIVLSRDGIDPESSEVIYLEDRLEANQVHHPWPPHEAPGYIPIDEANPVLPGTTGRNAWG